MSDYHSYTYIKRNTDEGVRLQIYEDNVLIVNEIQGDK